jgi:hypothetical protein
LSTFIMINHYYLYFLWCHPHSVFLMTYSSFPFSCRHICTCMWTNAYIERSWLYTKVQIIIFSAQWDFTYAHASVTTTHHSDKSMLLSECSSMSKKWQGPLTSSLHASLWHWEIFFWYLICQIKLHGQVLE